MCRRTAAEWVITMAQQHEDKMKRFEASIMKKASERQGEILRQIEGMERQELEKVQNDILADTYQMVEGEISELSTDYRRELAKKTLEYHGKLLKERDTMVEKLFTEARNLLIAFARSGSEYETFLLGKVRWMASNFAYENSHLLIQKCDTALEERIKEAFGLPCMVLVTEDFEIGGVILYNLEQSLIVDESLDTALKEQRQWFLENSGLTLS